MFESEIIQTNIIGGQIGPHSIIDILRVSAAYNMTIQPRCSYIFLLDVFLICLKLCHGLLTMFSMARCRSRNEIREILIILLWLVYVTFFGGYHCLMRSFCSQKLLDGLCFWMFMIINGNLMRSSSAATSQAMSVLSFKA